MLTCSNFVCCVRRNLVYSPLSYNDGNWHHLVGTVGAAGMQLYIDGALVASQASPTSNWSGAATWYIGRDTLGGYFNGVIDDVAIYSTQLLIAKCSFFQLRRLDLPWTRTFHSPSP